MPTSCCLLTLTEPEQISWYVKHAKSTMFGKIRDRKQITSWRVTVCLVCQELLVLSQGFIDLFHFFWLILPPNQIVKIDLNLFVFHEFKKNSSPFGFDLRRYFEYEKCVFVLTHSQCNHKYTDPLHPDGLGLGVCGVCVSVLEVSAGQMSAFSPPP